MTLIVVGWPLIVSTAEPHHMTFSSRHGPPFQPSMQAAAFRSICVLWQLLLSVAFMPFSVSSHEIGVQSVGRCFMYMVRVTLDPIPVYHCGPRSY